MTNKLLAIILRLWWVEVIENCDLVENCWETVKKGEEVELH